MDKLAHRLEENHGILTQMAERENDPEASTALPKLLLELVSQVDENDENKQSEKDNKNSDTPLECPEEELGEYFIHTTLI